LGLPGANSLPKRRVLSLGAAKAAPSCAQAPAAPEYRKQRMKAWEREQHS
jgi:hypothetical protein